MEMYRVKFNSVDSVIDFTNVVGKRSGKYEFVSDRYIIDAKSLLGVLSLDLCHSLNLRIENGKFPKELKSMLL